MSVNTLPQHNAVNLTDFIDFVPLPMAVHVNGVVRNCNNLFQKIIGVEKEAIVGTRLSKFVHQDDVRNLDTWILNIDKLENEFNAVQVRFVSLINNIIETKLKTQSIEFEGEAAQLIILQNVSEGEIFKTELSVQGAILRNITNSLPDVFYVVDANTKRYIFRSGGYLDMLGYGRVESNDEDYKLLISRVHSDDRHLLTKNINRLKESTSDDIIETEYRNKHKDGHYIWIYNRSKVYKRDDSGKPLLFFGISQDISKRKRIEEELKDKNSLIEKISSTIPDIINVVNVKTNEIVYKNTNLLTHLGFDEGKSKDKDFMHNLMHPDDRKKARVAHRQLKNLKNETEFISSEYRIKDSKGEYRWIYSRSANFKLDDKGEPEEIIGIAQDITDRKQIEEDLLNKNNLIQSITDTVPDHIYVFDLTMDQIVFENFNIIEYLGFKRPAKYIEEYRFTQSIVHPNDVQRFNDVVRSLWNLEENVFHETEFRMKDSEGAFRWFNSRTAVIAKDPVSDDPVRLLGILRDVTSSKETEAQLDIKVKELYTKNEELEKYIMSNVELEKFAYIASHDLKEPLRTIIGFSQLLDKKYGLQLDVEAKEYIDYIISGTKRMETLVEGLLEYSRVESKGSSFEECDLNKMLFRIEQDLKSSIEENDVEIIKDELPRIICDELQIRQLVQNLISNAIKFRGERKPVIQFHCKELKDFYQISVKDNGIGIDMKYKNQIFQIFQRLHKRDAYPGSGIGLSICKRIVERHEGEIWVESALGEGSNFIFTLKK